jgi:hypothetical protein
MPRASQLGLCVKCEGKWARIGVYTSYYALRRKPQSTARSTTKSRPRQVKGALPARGFCVDCFLREAMRQGLDTIEMDELRRALEAR